ncbi:MAG: N-acetyltransferase [Sphingomonadales bacterium]|nr:N-acetyltransferase [Sphingomonadales bacterium]MDE2171761.1 N-acetyltransferase [Sphingomonadales bacterium]
MTQITITRHPTPTGGDYRAAVEGETATGLLTWQNAPGHVWIADLTLVPSAIGGRGVAGALVEALVADAREAGAKILPSCSYVAAAFKRHPEWEDLRAGTDF